MILEFTKAEAYAIAACLLHTACSKSTTGHMSDHDKTVLLDVNTVAVKLIEASHLQPMDFKDLGTRILGAVLTEESTDKSR